MSRRWFAGALVVVFVSAGCGGDDAADPTTSAVESTSTTAGPTVSTAQPLIEGPTFANGDFEAGTIEPWISLDGDPPILDADAHSGDGSALLELRGHERRKGTLISYLTQDLKISEVPETLSGWYRVDGWKRGTPKQYLQFVVIAVGADNDPLGYGNLQIRYPLAGVSEPPIEIENASFKFITRSDPKIGEWVKFSTNVRDDFEELWGVVPESTEFVRFLFEVRYDDKEIGKSVAADVRYDDLEISL